MTQYCKMKDQKANNAITLKLMTIGAAVTCGTRIKEDSTGDPWE